MDLLYAFRNPLRCEGEGWSVHIFTTQSAVVAPLVDDEAGAAAGTHQGDTPWEAHISREPPGGRIIRSVRSGGIDRRWEGIDSGFRLPGRIHSSRRLR